jgi:hypothetical protein
VSRKNLIREPLLHFLLAGALVFGAYAWLNRGENGPGEPDRRIQVTEREISWLTETWTRQWQRPPDERELQGLVADYLREELLVREARSLGLDRDDVIVRRRMAQKMNFILEDTARVAAPTDEQLHALYESDRARFDTPATFSFETVFFSEDKRGDTAARDAQALLASLSAAGADADAGDAGDGTLLPREMSDADQQAIAGVFGDGFARAVMAQAPGSWHGPVASSFGQHLVRVTARRDGAARGLDDIRVELVEEWHRRGQADANAFYFKGLLERYNIEATDSVRPLIDPALAILRGGTG